METARRNSTAWVSVRTTLLAAAVVALATAAPAQQSFRSSTKAILTPAPIFQGAAVTYEIRIINTGSGGGPASLRDIIPACLDATGFSAANVTVTPGPASVAYDPPSRSLTVGFADFPPGTTQTITLTNLLAPAPGSPCCNQGSISGVLSTVLTDDPNTPLDPGDPTCFVTAAPGPSFSASTKDVAPRTGLAVGTPITYTLVIRNTGQGTATNVVVTDDLPACLNTMGFSQGSVTLSPGPGTVTYDDLSQQLTVTYPSIDPGVDQRITLNSLSTGQEIRGCCNQASIVSTELPTPTLTDDATVTGRGNPTCFDVNPPQTVSFANATKTANPTTLAPGAPIAYQIMVPNSGNIQANNVVVTDIFNACLNTSAFTTGNVTVTPGPGTVAYNGVSRTLTVTFSSIAAAVTQTIDVTGLTIAQNSPASCCNQGSIVSNELTAPQPTDDPTTPAALDDATCATVTTQPGVSFAGSTKNASPLNPAPGGQIVYNLVVTNSGGAAASNVVVTDNLSTTTPQGCLDLQNFSAANVTATGGGVIAYNAPVVTVTYPTLAAGASQTVTITVPANTQTGQCCNQAAIASNEANGTTVGPGGSGPTCVDIGGVAATNYLLRNAQYPGVLMAAIFTGPTTCPPPNVAGDPRTSLDPFGADCNPTANPAIDDDDTHLTGVTSGLIDPVVGTLLPASGTLIFYQVDQSPPVGNTLKIVKQATPNNTLQITF